MANHDDREDDPNEIKILIATDNHVGYLETDPIRGEDSARTFDEIIRIAKDREVDMILLAGDLFHDNKPSRKALYDVMKTLRRNCLGDKPCELEMLSDASENFSGPFHHANYEDPDINVAIPVFSIHGNHDDPSGEGTYSALDILAVSGLVNYYGKTSQSDKIEVKPVLLQKGRTKLALYGLSNVRDERLFRTFRDGNVKFFQPGDLPGVKKSDWFNLMSVHQNHFAHTETGYLPENFLPEFLDLVIWGHEHECQIEPLYNPEMGFHVMQPGSSVATSLNDGESVPKHVAILKVAGKKFDVEPIRLKTVRPFIMKEITLAEEKALKGIWKKEENRLPITHHLHAIVEDMIRQGWDKYLENHDNIMPEEESNEEKAGRPLIRLRVEYSAPEGGRFDVENAQRFSSRFVGMTANATDVVQFYRKKKTSRTSKVETVIPEESVLAQITLDSIKVDKLVKEFLAAQSLSILPQNSFGDAVSQFVDKDDKHAMEMFVNESLTSQVKNLLSTEEPVEDDDIADAMDRYRAKLEELFASGVIKKTKPTKLKPKPDHWDSDLDGAWEDQAGALVRSEDEDENEDSNLGAIPPKPARGRDGGRGRGGRGATAASSRRTAATKATNSRATRGKKQEVIGDDDEESDVLMLDDEDDEEGDEDQIFVKETRATSRKAPTTRSTASTRATSKTALAQKTATRQSTLNFSPAPPQPAKANGARKKAIEVSDDEISDDDAFEPVSTAKTKSRR